MMTMRMKTTILIILIVFITTVTNFFSGLYFTNHSLEKTMEQDLEFAIGIADRLVSTKMDLMKTEAITVAAQLQMSGSEEELAEQMAEQMNVHSDISSLSVFGRDGVIASYSVPQHEHDLNLHADYLEMVYDDGATVISSPFYCTIHGEYVMNVYTPMGSDGILAVTMPGNTFSDMLSEQRLWQTGSIFMLNEVGMFIGATDQESVQAMNDYVLGNEGNLDEADEEIGGLVQKILSSDKGVERYSFEGVESLCAHSRIGSSALGWCVAVTVPISASPQADAMRGQLYSAVVFLILGVAAAFFLSRVTSKPFQEIERQNRDLAELNKTIQAQADAIREEHERVQLMMDATPLACRLWNRDFELIEGNEAAVRLFGLRDKQEYMDRYFELSPEHQPDGQTTQDKIKEIVTETFEKGEGTYDWLYRLSDGTPLPCEVTMVRIPYGDDYVVAAYSRDLREQKKMLAEIEHRDNLLDISRRVSFTLFDTAENKDIVDILAESLKLLGQCIDVDQSYITQNETLEEVPYFTCRAAWASDASRVQSAITPGMRFPWGLDTDWDGRLRQGECMNGPVRDLPASIQAFFSPFEAKSVLVIPVFVQEQFWGLVGFSDCKSGRFFNTDEVDILRSMCLIMAAAVNRSEQDTRIRDTSAELEIALADATEANDAKSDFLAHMSHEIRTPLNAVVGLSELVIDNDELDHETVGKLRKIHDSGMTILSIVNDILDISKIESGKFELNPIRYDTPSLINDAVTLNAVRIGEKDITFKIDVDENLPGSLYGDDLRVKQVFNNLLSNAFKYTHSGTVEWKVSFEEDGDNIWLISHVKDSGIGIKPEDVQKLFSAYNQVDTKTNRRVEGTGLGLTITKSLVEMMDGSITVESAYGKGSTFHVRLRQGAVSGTPIGKEVARNLMEMRYTLDKRDKNAKLMRANLSYAHVLVVDDVLTNLDVIKGMLKPYSVKVDCAISGPQAIEMIQTGSPRYSAIFMDHMMPGMDGIETTRMIREEIGTDYARNIPVIALTANAIVGNEEMFLSHGFQAFISKPIDMAKLDFVLRQWVRDKALEKKLWNTKEDEYNDHKPVSNDSSPENISIKGLDIERGLGRFGGDAAVFIDVLRSYASNTPSLLNSLCKHLEAGNLEDYAIVVHGIKGSSYGIFAQDVGKEAEDLEMSSKAGDLNTVNAGHFAFVRHAEELIGDIQRGLDMVDSTISNPVAAEPDPALLTELREACKAFDMDRVDSAMEQLESLRYENGDKLIAWLREQVNNMTFEEIADGEWPFETSLKNAGPFLPLGEGGRPGFTVPGASVLIADDNETNLKAIAGILEPLQMQLDTATNGEEALRMMRQKRYHLVLMDHRMPDMDGLQATRALRQMKAAYYKKVPVVALTADEDASNAKDFLQAGMNDAVEKPVQMETLYAVIARWLPKRMLHYKEKKPSRPSARVRREGVEGELPVIVGIDSAAGVQNSGSKKMFVSLLENFYSLIDRKSAHMEADFAQGRLRDVATNAHALKGAARMIGARALSEEFARLERYGGEGDVEALAREMPGVLRQYRSFKPLLESFGRAVQEQKPASPQKWGFLLKKLISALDRFDQDDADETFGQMEKLQAPPGYREDMETLRACLADVAAEEAVKTAQSMLKKLEKLKNL